MGTSAGIMFLDVKGYSKLGYHDLKEFHTKICMALSMIIAKGEEDEPYLYKKTWGDGVVLVHKDLYKLTLIALELRDYFNKQQYETDSKGSLINKKLRCRIAIHYGKFETVDDPIDGNRNCYGHGIILPARIEPVTEPGHVWATKSATQNLYDEQKADGFGQLSWSYVGHVPLAKEFDTNHIWEMLWVSDTDVSGKKGNQTEPIVPQNNTKAQEPESCDPIDDASAVRIQAITRENPRKHDITVCSKAPGRTNECPMKAPSAQVISEISRNSKAASEEIEVAHWCSIIDRDIEEIRDNYKLSIPVTYFQLKHLYDDISAFLGCVKNLEHDGTWPDSDRKRIYRPIKYLYWRTKNYREDAKNMCETFVNSSELFKGFFEQTFPDNEKIDFEQNITVDGTTANALDFLHTTSGYLKTHLQSIGKQRIIGSKEALKEGFKSFNRFKFAQHLKAVIQVLTKMNERIPSIWKL